MMAEGETFLTVWRKCAIDKNSIQLHECTYWSVFVTCLCWSQNSLMDTQMVQQYITLVPASSWRREKLFSWLNEKDLLCFMMSDIAMSAFSSGYKTTLFVGWHPRVHVPVVSGTLYNHPTLWRCHLHLLYLYQNIVAYLLREYELHYVNVNPPTFC